MVSNVDGSNWIEIFSHQKECIESLPVVSGGPRAQHPPVCFDLVSRQALCCGIRGKKEEKMENMRVVSSWKTRCMSAGCSYANQNKLNFSFWIPGTNVVMDEAGGIWDVQRV